MSVSKPRTINFITTNKNKLAEAKAILGDVVKLQSQALDLPEIQGTSDEIAKDKCRRAAIAINGPALVEDSSLEFDALNGLPGPYIKWFLDALGNDGLNNLLAAYEDKSATAACTFAFTTGPGAEPLLFHGRTRGKIMPKRGLNGFGFDPIFEYEGQTYAEMESVKKNMVSERHRGLSKLKEWLADREEKSGASQAETR